MNIEIFGDIFNCFILDIKRFGPSKDSTDMAFIFMKVRMSSFYANH